MKYNFDEIIDRHHTDAIKIERCKALFGTEDVLPLWVADMDFRTPDFIIDAVKKRAEHPIFGYSKYPAGMFPAMINWIKELHGWEVHKHWVGFVPGIVSGIAFAIDAYTEKGDEIIVQPPVYYPFMDVVNKAGRKLLYNQLLEVNGRFEMNFDDLLSKITDKTRMIIISNPHNPGGRIWDAVTLKQLAEICYDRGVLVISDEIHSDITLYGNKHTKATSILEVAKKHQLSTGIVVTCALSHATPASFAAHQINRNMDEEIAADYLTSDIDVFIGGGRKYFENRTDERNLTQELKKKDYQIAYNLNEVKSVKTGKLAGLLYDDQNPPMPERGKMLPESVSAALDILKNNKKGFVMMVEGSQIDWACHDNDADLSTKEVLDFDETVGRVLDFAQKDKNTLVIITADHETGGMTLPNGSIADRTVKAAFSTKNHSGVCVPVYSYGPGAENFRGFMENSSLKGKIEKLLKINQ
jgi:hypothetical protein